MHSHMLTHACALALSRPRYVSHPHSLTHNLRIDTLALAMRSETQTKEEGEGMGGQGRAAEVTDRRLFSFWLHT